MRVAKAHNNPAVAASRMLVIRNLRITLPAGRWFPEIRAINVGLASFCQRAKSHGSDVKLIGIGIGPANGGGDPAR
jgi:hypothetical protein